MKSSRSLPNRTRPPVEQDRIARLIRQRIIAGKLVPGTRLPPRLELARTHKVSSLTVQRAMNQLLEDGFIEARGRSGTFVAARPPHLYRFALAFQPSRHDSSWSNLWDALISASHIISGAGEGAGDSRFNVYLGVDKHLQSDDARRLQRDIQRRALAGVIFDQFSVQAAEVLPLAETAVPAVSIIKQESVCGLTTLIPHIESFFDLALKRLKTAGCRRVAVVALGKADIWEMLPLLARQFTMHGLEYRREFVQGVPLPAAQWAIHTVRLLFSTDAEMRPDGLIIADDNLVQPVVEGLRQLSLQIPRDLKTVSACNWPEMPEVDVDVEWLGFDLCQILEKALDLLRNPQSATRPLRVLCEPQWIRKA